MLLPHLMALADSRALLSTGSNSEISIAIMPITTSSSTSVNASLVERRRTGADECMRFSAPCKSSERLEQKRDAYGCGDSAFLRECTTIRGDFYVETL